MKKTARKGDGEHMDDSEIIELYFARDERAIAETDEKYGAYCKKIAINILSDADGAEECCNDTYYKTWNSIPPTRPNIFSAFLARIVRNTALDKYREANREKRGGRVAESLEELGECIGEESTLDDLSLCELGELISDFLRREREITRKIFVRRYFFEYSVSEIAKAYGLTESNVKTSLSRTRRKLALYLQRKEVKL